MMEDVERRRGRGLPVDALEGRLELLRRRGVLAIDTETMGSLMALVSELNRAQADGCEIETNLVGWFTRLEKRSGVAPSEAVVRAEAYVEYLLDFSGAGELTAFGTLRAALGAGEDPHPSNQ
jgi:hypothetical protein